MTDAVIRTLFRVYVTRRNLLEWVTAAQAKSGVTLTLGSIYRWMSGAVALAVAAGVLVAWVRPQALPVAAPFLLLWLLSPLVAWWISLPRARSERSPFPSMTRARSG